MSLAPIVHHAQGPTATSLPDHGPSPCFLLSFMPSKLCFGDSRATFAVPGPGAGWAQCWWRRKDSVGMGAPCSTSWAAHSPLGTIPLLPPPHPSMHQGGITRHSGGSLVSPGTPRPHVPFRSLTPLCQPHGESQRTCVHLCSSWSLQCHVCPMETYTTPRAYPASTHQLGTGSTATKKRGRDRI